MHGGKHRRKSIRVKDLASILRHAKIPAEERLSCGGPQADNKFRFDHFDLAVEPGPAGRLLASAGLLVKAALAARLPLEMLHRIGDVDEVAVDTGFDQTAVEQMAGRPDEGLAGQVLAIARLLADEDQTRMRIAFSENSLRRVLIKRTAAASECCLAKSLQRVPLWKEIGGGH